MAPLGLSAAVGTAASPPGSPLYTWEIFATLWVFRFALLVPVLPLGCSLRHFFHSSQEVGKDFNIEQAGDGPRAFRCYLDVGLARTSTGAKARPSSQLLLVATAPGVAAVPAAPPPPALISRVPVSAGFRCAEGRSGRRPGHPAQPEALRGLRQGRQEAG